MLGGYGRNTFINLGFALGNSAMFYGAIIFCQYLGSFAILSPPTGGLDTLDRVRNDRAVRWGRSEPERCRRVDACSTEFRWHDQSRDMFQTSQRQRISASANPA